MGVSEPLHRRLRPDRFDGIIGQPFAVATLKSACASGAVSHAYLMHGLRGSGKTSAARILAAAINCRNVGTDGEPCNSCLSCVEIRGGRSLSVTELDAASNNSVDDVRAICEDASQPHLSGVKVYILDEAHVLSSSASNALLKTLEEPPSGVVFILATTDADKLLPTVISRCQSIRFGPIAYEDIFAFLRDTADENGIDASDGDLRGIAESCGGSLRDALSELDAVALWGADRRTFPRLTGELYAAVANGDVSTAVRCVDEMTNDGVSAAAMAESLLRAIVDDGRRGVVVLSGSDVARLQDGYCDLVRSAVPRITFEGALFEIMADRERRSARRA